MKNTIFLTWETLLPAVFVEFLTLFSSSSDQLLLPSSASLLLFALISPYLLSSPNILWSSPLYPSLAATKKFPLFFLSIPKNLEKKKEYSLHSLDSSLPISFSPRPKNPKSPQVGDGVSFISWFWILQNPRRRSNRSFLFKSLD